MILGLLALWFARAIVADAVRSRPDHASDALPVYLSAATLAADLDPTSRADLQATYQAKGLQTRAATFSTLYPVTFSAMLLPTAGASWEQWVRGWRWCLLLAAFATGALWCGARHLRPAARPLAFGLGASLVLSFPSTAECVRLGQVNMLLALLMSAALLLIGRSRYTWAAGLAAVGVAIKLVPGALFVPLAAGRRWRALLVGGLVYLVLFGLACTQLPMAAIVEGVQESIQFQDVISPDWASKENSPLRWLAFVAFLRHKPIFWMTLAMGGVAVLLRPRPRLMVAWGAMFSAWLGASASAFHVLYTPLFFPALLYLACWPLERRSALRWALPAALLAVGGCWALYLVDLPGVVVEARMVLAGMGLWLLCGARLWLDWRSVEQPLPARLEPLRPWLAPAFGLLGGTLAAGTLPGEGPQGPPVPLYMENPDAAGFILPGDAVPGAQMPVGVKGSALPQASFNGRWPRVPAGSSLRPGTHKTVARHLENSEALWTQLAQARPEEAERVAWVLAARPTGRISALSVAELVTYLTREGLVLAQLDEQLSHELRVSYREALTGTAPGRSTRRFRKLR